MKQKISDLAKKAGMFEDKYGMFFAIDNHNEDGVDLELYTKMIIQECSKIITQGGYWSGGLLGPKHPATPTEIAEMIKEYFGVE